MAMITRLELGTRDSAFDRFLESTSDACDDCVGLIESRIRVGPVERGVEIVVNGVRVVV